MSAAYTIFGPVEIHVHKEHGGWAAYVEPFSIAGDGKTEHKAALDALENLGEYLRMLMHRIEERGHTRNLQVFCPISKEMRSNRVLHALIWATGIPRKAKKTRKKRTAKGRERKASRWYTAEEAVPLSAVSARELLKAECVTTVLAE